MREIFEQSSSGYLVSTDIPDLYLAVTRRSWSDLTHLLWMRDSREVQRVQIRNVIYEVF